MAKIRYFCKKHPVDLSRIIAELLEEHDYVIVPGLGAFKAAHLPARFDEDGKKLLPPSKTVSFNPDVKVNDGMVTGYLVHRLKLPVSRAQKLTGEFSDDVVYRLDQGEAVVLEGLGTLIKTGVNIDFTPFGNAIEPASSFGLQPVEVSLPGTNRQENEITMPGAGKQEEEISQPEFGIGHSGSISSQRENMDREAEDDRPGADQNVTSPVPIKGSPEKLPKGKPPITFRPVIWLALILLPVLLASAWFLFFHKKQDQDRLKPTTTAIVPTPTPGPTNADSLAQIPEPSGSDSTLSLQNVTPREPLYFLVGGSFQSRQNADTYISKMSGKGYQPVHLGQYGSYFIVAIDSFKTEREAVRAVNHFNDLYPDAGAWIFHRKRK